MVYPVKKKVILNVLVEYYRKLGILKMLLDFEVVLLLL